MTKTNFKIAKVNVIVVLPRPVFNFYQIVGCYLMRVYYQKGAIMKAYPESYYLN